MKFDNAQFEKNCKETMSTLDKLKEKLHSTKSASGLSDLGEAAKGLGLDAVDRSLTSINKKMSILGVAGATVISELTKSAMNFAKTVTTAVPNIIKQGGWTRAMNIEKAKFQLEGLGIAWSQVGEQVSNAVSGTAYSMDSAAKAASQLAASGVEISGVGDQMERSLKAISGVAAQTNSSYDDIANIFTTVAGNGRLMGDQLRQLSVRGMNAAAALGKAMGVTESEVRDMVSKGQISFEQFSDIMFETFGENAFKANQTFEGSLDNMKAALKRTGEAFAGPVIRQTIPVFNALRESINKANKWYFEFTSE
jgi:tape measure domain-containing protein